MGSSSRAAVGHDYEVFLSFRGPDTRTSFTDHLYHSLKNAGVHVFRDDEELRKGEVIADNLIEAIDKSTISIPIFSQGYASSKWCLNELAHIAGRMKSSKHQVMPIFYHISPSDVRHQTATFGVSFEEHERSFKEETVVEWKRALKEVGQLKGWHIQKGSSEAEVIEDVLNKVLRQLKKSYVALLPNFLVGVEDRVEDIKSIISAGSGDQKIIGIHGPGGIGKSTLATVVYNQLSNDYEGCSFLHNVRETSDLKDTGIMRLQNQLLSNILKSDVFKVDSVHDGIATIKERLSRKKVLICFDDVSNINQLKALMGDSSWFGPGSKIIITTRNKQLLRAVGAYSSYGVPEMDFARSLQLFSNLAFRRDSPPSDYMTYSTRVVELTGGLPLALEVIGSSLHGITQKDSWESKLEKLEKVPDKDVQKSLMISYEELDNRQKQIFRDVACFFVGYDKTTVLYFWDSDLYPKEGIEVLEHLSLLKIKQSDFDYEIHAMIWMHDQIIDFGRNLPITYQIGNEELQTRSRLRMGNEAYNILKEGQREESVEAIRIGEWKLYYEYPLTGELFDSVPSLKILEIEYFAWQVVEDSELEPEVGGSKIIKQKLINSIVLPQLRWLSLNQGLDPQDMWSINLCECKKVVILDLSKSDITHEWVGWSQMKAATNLKVLNLSRCLKLKMTPDLSAHGKLERLILSWCSSLTQIHKSIGRLKQLVLLDLRWCESLKQLPEEIGQLELLDELDLSSSGVSVLPGSFGNIKRLRVLNLSGCGSLREIPSEIGGLSHLTTLKIPSGATMGMYQVPELPESLICLHLQFGINPTSVPCLSNLVNLRELFLVLRDLKSLLWSIGKLDKLKTLTLELVTNERCPRRLDFGSLSLLKKLVLRHCKGLQRLPRLPSSLVDILISDCNALEGPIDVSNLNQLLKFKINNSCAISEIRGLPSSLVELHLWCCISLKSIGDISNLTMLSTIDIEYCAITEIRGLDSLQNLKNKTLRLATIENEDEDDDKDEDEEEDQ